MEVRTPKEFFETVLPAKFTPDKANGIEATVQMNITGPNGGNWAIKIENQRMTVKEGVDPSPTIGIKIADGDFIDVVNGKLSGIEAVMAGKLEFKGSIGAGMKLLNTGLI
jgi:putative sterol carrier protein